MHIRARVSAKAWAWHITRLYARAGQRIHMAPRPIGPRAPRLKVVLYAVSPNGTRNTRQSPEPSNELRESTQTQGITVIKVFSEWNRVAA